MERANIGIEDVAPNKIGRELQQWVTQFLEEVASEFNDFEAKLNPDKEEEKKNDPKPPLRNESYQFFQQHKEFSECQAAIERGKKLQEEIEHHLSGSHFTKLAKQQPLIQQEIRHILQAGQKLDKCYEEGVSFKQTREQWLKEHQEALKQVVQDMGNPETLIAISSVRAPERNSAKQAKEEQASEKPINNTGNRTEVARSSQTQEQRQAS